MSNSIACVVIASEKRRSKVLNDVMPSVITQGFDEVVCVYDWPEALYFLQRRFQDTLWYHVEPITRTTRDALLKRDIGTLATTSDIIVYLCDDHALDPNFCKALREVADEPWDALVPNRYTVVPSGVGPHNELINMALNNGESEGYCAGHVGVFRRRAIQGVSWMSWHADPQWRNWDVLTSKFLQQTGERFCFHPRAELSVRDLEPEQEPWK